MVSPWVCLSIEGVPKAANQTRRRPTHTPPHIPLKQYRVALGVTLVDVGQAVAEVTGKRAPTQGTLSAIESGLRGVSPEMLVALNAAYTELCGLEPGSIAIDYEARAARGPGGTKPTRPKPRRSRGTAA